MSVGLYCILRRRNLGDNQKLGVLDMEITYVSQQI